VTISTVNRQFASLHWPAKLSKACRRVAADGVIVEHHTAHGWRFVTVGSSFTCPIKGLPTRVARDLGISCISTSAISPAATPTRAWGRARGQPPAA
jgi:hypothetical protein